MTYALQLCDTAFVATQIDPNHALSVQGAGRPHLETLRSVIMLQGGRCTFVPRPRKFSTMAIRFNGSIVPIMSLRLNPWRITVRGGYPCQGDLPDSRDLTRSRDSRARICSLDSRVSLSQRRCQQLDATVPIELSPLNLF